MRPTDLADELRISKQAVNDLLGDLERQGYIRRHVDPADRRSRLIRLTPKGMKLEDTVRLAARDAERQLERELGRERFHSFREALVEAAHILNDRP
jgi:DNA-binding MarR family transcriptional regulator